MPKSRSDVQVVCYWIDRRIRTIGKPEVLQLSRDKTFYVVRSDRPRLPRMKLEPLQTANNLMVIPAGSVLNKRYVPIGQDSYLVQFLTDPVQVEKLGIYFRGVQAFVPIYEVIDGLAFAQRKSEHMLAGWQDELSMLRNTISEAHLILADQSFRIATTAERRQVQLELSIAQRRIADIESIVAEHLYRQVTVKFAFKRACSRLSEMGMVLERIAYHIRTRSVRIGAIQVVTNRILSELPYFNSKEVRDQTRSVIRALTALKVREDAKSIATYLLSERLREAAAYLFKASETLRVEAEKIPEEERAAANELKS